MEQKKGLGGWVMAALMIAGLCYAASYSLPYIKGVFYGPMMEATGATNTQLGLIMSVYGFGNIVFNLIGGFVTDKLDYKKCIVVSLLGTTILSIWLALAPSVMNMYIIWGLFGLTTFFVFNPAIFKLPRMIVPDELVGESIGFFSFAQSISYMIINFASLYVYNRSEAKVSQASAFSRVVWTYAAFTLVAALGCMLVFRKVKDVKKEGEEEDKFTFSQLFLVMKEPGLWMMIICGFCLYSTTLTASYFVPYFHDVFGVAITFAGILGVLNMYGGRLFSPILGKIATKTKYVSRMVVFGAVFLFTLFVLVLLFSAYVPVGVLVGVSLGTGVLSTLFTNICLAMTPEANVARNASGTAMGLYAAIAYAPDLFQHTLFGHWLDKYGNTGYIYMFIFTLVLLTVGGVSAFMLYKKSRRENVFGDAPKKVEA